MQILFHFGFFLLNIYDAKGFKEKKQRILEKVSSANKKNFLYIQIRMNIIEETCNKIVSPPKFKYSLFDLGPVLTKTGRRFDFQIPNRKNQLLQCSLYQPSKNLDPFLQTTTVVYLHSMNGSRLQCTIFLQRPGLTYVDEMLKLGISVCSFDFSGCGNSEGNHISFGCNQKFDIECVLGQLVKRYKKQKFVLWGRSMGAVAGIKFVEWIRDKYCPFDILAMILDSPFKSFKNLIVQIGAKRSELPQFFVYAGYFAIRRTLEEKGEFSMEDLEIVNSVKNIQDTPTLFLASKEDTTIHYNHSEQLYQELVCSEKKLFFINGLHNESRDEDYLNYVKRYIFDIVKRRKKGKSNTNRNQKYRRLQINEIIRRNQKVESEQTCSCQFFGFNEVNEGYSLIPK